MDLDFESCEHPQPGWAEVMEMCAQAGGEVAPASEAGCRNASAAEAVGDGIHQSELNRKSNT